uniref:Endonuclease n=1 Tax=Trichogramma kaykai TaxID=54128 RepID=A0ABD2WNL9_9HYME
MKLLRDSEVRRDLDRRTQAKGETIFDFADCFRYLVRHLRRKPEETELVEMFLRNLRSEYRRHIVAARPWTIDEAVELGQELEQMLEDDERFEEPPPKSKMNLADAGVQTKKTVKIAAIEEVANSSVSDGPQKGNKTPAKKQTAKQQQKVPQSNKTKAEKATKTSKAKDSAEETPNSEPVTSYELSPNPWHYPAYDEWQAHAMSAMQYAPAVAMPTMPPWPTWPPRPMYQAPWPPAPPEQGRGQMAWNNLVRPPVQASANAGNDSPGIDRPKGKFSGPCFNCQTPGHHAANCPHKICTICKQNGHGQNACPNKPIAPPPNAGSQACTEKCQMCGQAGFTVLTCPQSAPIDSQETQSIEDSSAEDGERVVEVVYTEENELPEEDDWNESLNKIETEAIVGQVMHEAEEYSRNSLAKVISAKATRKAAETREESVERPPQAKWESCLRGLEDESQQLWLEIQPSPEITIGPDAQTPDQAEIAALYNDNRHFAKIALGGREYTALIDPGATCSMVLPRVAEEIGATVEKKAGWLQGGAGGISKTWGDLPMTLSVDGLDGRIRAKLCDTVRHDAVLGMDFIFEFDVDLRGGRHMWRAREGPWHPSKLPEAEDRPLLFAECAGISLCEPGEVERLNELINRLLPEDNPAPGLTNRSEHHIRVMTNTPVRHHLRRMSPAMEVVAQAEVKKLYEAGFIERSASDWCSAPKSSNQARSGLMGQRHLEGPWSVVAADIIGPKPASKGGVRYVLVFVDLFTKYVELIGLRKANGKAVVKAMDELIINRWGCPRYLLTDNGTEFVNKDVGQYLASLGVEQTTIPPYIARCNPTERVNRNLRSMIASYIEEDQSDWDLHLQELKFALNTAHHDSIGTTPSFLNFGRGKRPREDLTERSRTRSVTFRFARRPGMSRSGEFPDGNGDSHPFRLFCRSSTRACYRGGRHICLTVRMRSPVYDDEAEEVQAREREEPGAALPGVAAVEPAVEDLAAPDVIAAEEVAGGLAEGGPSTERSSRSESPIAMEIEPPAAAEAEAAEMRELTLDLTSERRTSLDLPTVRLSAIVDQSNAQPSSGPSQDLRFICDSDSASENERYLRFRSERPSDERLSSERLRSAIRSRRARDSQ